MWMFSPEKGRDYVGNETVEQKSALASQWYKQGRLHGFSVSKHNGIVHGYGPQDANGMWEFPLTMPEK